jgi:hypothetical protein
MDYRQVEQEFRQLKTQYDAGRLTEADFKARLQGLMLQDEQGRWWMIGYETGQWYVHDGEKWVQRELPPVAEANARVTEAPRSAAPVAPAAAPAPPTKRRWLWVAAGIIGIIGLILVIMLLRSGMISRPRSEPSPGAQFWADRDVIKPGECTILYWLVPGAEQVRIVGPGFDPQSILPGTGERKICPGENAAYRLLSPDEQVLAAIVIQVHE